MIMFTLPDYKCKTQSRFMFTLPDYKCKTQSRIMLTLPDFICKPNQGSQIDDPIWPYGMVCLSSSCNWVSFINKALAQYSFVFVELKVNTYSYCLEVRTA